MIREDWKDYCNYLSQQIQKQEKHKAHNIANVKIELICNLNIYNFKLQLNDGLKQLRKAS